MKEIKDEITNLNMQLDNLESKIDAICTHFRIKIEPISSFYGYKTYTTRPECKECGK